MEREENDREMQNADEDGQDASAALPTDDMDELCFKLRQLATDSHKYRAKKDRKQQRSSFREVLRAVEVSSILVDRRWIVLFCYVTPLFIMCATEFRITPIAYRTEPNQKLNRYELYI